MTLEKIRRRAAVLNKILRMAEERMSHPAYDEDDHAVEAIFVGREWLDELEQQIKEIETVIHRPGRRIRMRAS